MTSPEQIRPTLPLYAKPASTLYSFYLYQVGDPEMYTDWFETIRQSGEGDIIKIHINSPGGLMSTAIQMMRVMAESPATIVASVEGECMSAATLIMMNADMVEISDHSMFMFHNYSGGAFGKGGEMYDKIIHERGWIDQILRSCYDSFLTEDEIDRMMDGKDFWMSGDEVTERLQLRAEKLKEIETHDEE